MLTYPTNFNPTYQDDTLEHLRLPLLTLFSGEKEVIDDLEVKFHN